MKYSTSKNKTPPEQITQRDFIVIMILPLLKTQHIKYLLKINCFQITYLQYKEQYLIHVQQKVKKIGTHLEGRHSRHNLSDMNTGSPFLKYHTVKTRMILATLENKAHIVRII